VSKMVGSLGMSTAFKTMQEGVFGMTAKAALKRPSLGAPALFLGGSFLYEMLKPVGKAVFDNPARNVAEQAQQQRDILWRQKMSQITTQRYEQSIAKNAARLAAANPQLYNEVMAGRRLPQGAVVLGGRPRVDLMEELAMSMAGGQFQKPADPNAELEWLTRTSSSSSPSKGTRDTFSMTRQPIPESRRTESQSADELIQSLGAE